MKISTVREFRDNATGLLRSKDPILVTHRDTIYKKHLKLPRDF